MNILNLKSRVMLGVYCLYCLRILKTPFGLGVFSTLIFAAITSALISVPSVIANTLASENLYGYFVIAFANTDPSVKAVIFLFGFSAFFILGDIILRSFSSKRFILPYRIRS